MKPALLIFFSLFLSVFAKGQTSFGLKWNAEKDTVWLGEPFFLEVRLPQPKPTDSMVWPELTDSLGPFELLLVEWLDSASLRSGLRLKVVAYDSGTVQVPEMVLGLLEGNDTLNLQIPIHPIEVLAPNVNLQADFQDILANPDPGYHWHEFLPWIGLVLILALLGLVYWFILKKRKQPKPLPETPKKNPFDAAIDALRELKVKQANLTDSEIKEFYTKAVDVLRNLVEEVYSIDVSEMASSEWLALWKRRPEHLKTGQELNYVLHIADLVKFAKQQPGQAERQQLIEAAEAFVEACRTYSQPLAPNSHE